MTTAMIRRATSAALFVLVLGLATILGAWGFQLIGGYVPCKLCLEERIPYYVGLPIALLAYRGAHTRWPPTLVQFLLVAAGIVFAIGAGLGTYHAGAEWGWWPGPSDCGGGTATTTSAGNLLNQLSGIHVVSCSEASWRFPDAVWGLSFAGWNAVVSAMLAVAALWGALGRAR
jgi:disulfide bond formation protein DsbB